MRYTFSLVVVFCVLAGVAADDPCINYQPINNPYRSPKYRFDGQGAALCDYLLKTGWYRFTSIVGGTIPTTKPEPYMCGTVAPIWMSGSLPDTVGLTVSTRACVNVGNRYNGCLTTIPMSVKKCTEEAGDYYVYYLRAPYGCSMAYCAGEKQPCPKGQIGIVPNCIVSQVADFPYALVPTPNITYLDNRDDIMMRCMFEFPPWTNVSFQVKWFANNKPKGDPVSFCNAVGEHCQIRESLLPQSHYKAGERLHCQLRMKYTTHPNNTWTSLYRESEYFYVGIEVSPKHADLKECDENTTVTVTFRPTIPIIPAIKGSYTRVIIYVPARFGGLAKQAAVDTCDLKFYRSDLEAKP